MRPVVESETTDWSFGGATQKTEGFSEVPRAHAADINRFQSIVLEDADGRPHTFRFRSMLVPTGHEMEALETIDDPHEGYRFAILGDFESDPWELFSTTLCAP